MPRFTPGEGERGGIRFLSLHQAQVHVNFRFGLHAAAYGVNAVLRPQKIEGLLRLAQQMSAAQGLHGINADARGMRPGNGGHHLIPGTVGNADAGAVNEGMNHIQSGIARGVVHRCYPVGGKANCANFPLGFLLQIKIKSLPMPFEGQAIFLLVHQENGDHIHIQLFARVIKRGLRCFLIPCVGFGGYNQVGPPAKGQTQRLIRIIKLGGIKKVDALFRGIENQLGSALRRLCAGLPPWLRGALLDGVYATVARVVAVMLPPMAIFFPLFTLLEDFGYLPRVAFLLDEGFRRSGACGKQALTMCMGFGCNAAGVTGCRIVDQPRERLMAIVTNALVPCNGRFPALIFLISLSFSGGSALAGAGLLTLCVALSVGMTLLSDRLLHRTVLRGAPSAFVLEMPPYRRPRVWQVLVRSVRERTLRILARAAVVAAPAGLLIWVLANCRAGGAPLLQVLSGWLDPAAAVLGLNGAVLLAFLLGSPANELVLPVLMMILTAGGTLADPSSAAMAQLLGQSGWTWQLSLCTLVFFLFHWPCTTTLLTIRRETRSTKWTLLALVLPTALGCLLCAALRLLLPG